MPYLDVINQNFYDPHPNEGALGRPVAISPREVLKMHSLFKINRYNLLASDRIPLNRTLSDVRNKRLVDVYNIVIKIHDILIISQLYGHGLRIEFAHNVSDYCISQRSLVGFATHRLECD